MKTVLVIADFLHASPRILGLVKYLPGYQWNSIVISGHPPEKAIIGCRVVQTPFPDTTQYLKSKLGFNKDKSFQSQLGVPLNMREKSTALISRLARMLKEVATYPDNNKGWKSYAICAAEDIAKKNNVDLILSSSSPVITHVIAKELKHLINKPWVADLRDLWTQNHNYQYSKFRKYFERRLEVKILDTADELVTVSQPWARDLASFHNRETIHYVTNGFDPENYESREPGLTKELTITYTGQIYTNKQSIEMLLSAIHSLRVERKISEKYLKVRFFGPYNEKLQEGIDKLGLQRVIKQNGFVSRELASVKQRESQILLLFNWADPVVKGCHGTKIFEYLAAKRPILSVGGTGEDVIDGLINETKAGVYCRTSDQVKQYLLKSYSEYCQTGTVVYFGKSEKIGSYSHKEMAKSFSIIFDALT